MTSVDTEALEAKVNHRYRELAERPDGAFHFELGERVALRVGYGAELLTTVPTEAVDSFAGVALFDRPDFEPRGASGSLSGRRSRTPLQSSKGPRPQAWHFGRHSGKGSTSTTLCRQPTLKLI